MGAARIISTTVVFEIGGLLFTGRAVKKIHDNQSAGR